MLDDEWCLMVCQSLLIQQVELALCSKVLNCVYQQVLKLTSSSLHFDLTQKYNLGSISILAYLAYRQSHNAFPMVIVAVFLLYYYTFKLK